MSELAVRNALETHLKAIASPLATQWENAPFTPDPKKAYQQVYFLFGDPENPTMGDGFHRIVGIMQINLYYPLSGGSGVASTKAVALKDWFPRGSSYNSGGVTTTIQRTPAIGGSRPINDRYVIPVSIRFYANILS